MIHETLLGLTFDIGPKSFFQTNSQGAEILYSRVKDFFKEYLKGKTLYIFMALKDGKCTGARFVKEPSEVEAGFALSAKYEVWKEILSGKGDPMKAIMQGKMKLAGDMMKVMKYTKGATLLGQLTAKVPVEFFDEVK